MARSDLLIKLVKAGMSDDRILFRKVVEAIAAEERAKNHHILADKLIDGLFYQKQVKTILNSNNNNSKSIEELFLEIIPEKKLKDLFLPVNVEKACNSLIEEQHRSDLLKSHGIEPRHKLLLAGPPGNGKTSLAEAIAEELTVPLFVVRYESLIGSYLGETSSRLKKVFEHVSSRRCVLFFDEFDTIGKERGDNNETGEIKRVVSSLLMQIDRLPSHVVVITASNHPELLDRAVWRRFQLKLELPQPGEKELSMFLKIKENSFKDDFKLNISEISKKIIGMSFAEAEEFLYDIKRKYILTHNQEKIENIVKLTLEEYKNRFVL